MANFVNEKVVSFDSAFEEALKCLLECSMSRALKSKQNEVISSTLVRERIYLPWLCERPDTSGSGQQERIPRA